MSRLEGSPIGSQPQAHGWSRRRTPAPPRHGSAGVRLDQMPIPLLHSTRLRNREPVNCDLTAEIPALSLFSIALRLEPHIRRKAAAKKHRCRGSFGFDRATRLKAEEPAWPDLAGILALTNDNPRRTGRGLQITLVAGVGFEPTTFRL